jgi:hypothetical protein
MASESPGCQGHYLPSPEVRVKAAHGAKARRYTPLGQSRLEYGGFFRCEENYKQGVVAPGGFRGGLNPTKGGAYRLFKRGKQLALCKQPLARISHKG